MASSKVDHVSPANPTQAAPKNNVMTQYDDHFVTFNRKDDKDSDSGSDFEVEDSIDIN